MLSRYRCLKKSCVSKSNCVANLNWQHTRRGETEGKVVKKAENNNKGETIDLDRWGEGDKCKRLSKQDSKI